MSTRVCVLIWTALWMLFMGGLCLVFNAAWPLWFLFLWGVGLTCML